MSDSVFYFILSVISFFVGVVVTRWIFGINSIIRYLKAQRDLLALIAKKQGIDETIIDNIIQESNK